MSERRPIPGYPGYFATSEGVIETESGLPLTELIQYPRVRVRTEDGRKSIPIHTLIALAFHGDRPTDAEIDHLDDDPRNAAASNLRYVSRAANQERRRHGSHNALKTHCPKGHAYEAENTFVCKRGRRSCRTCMRAARADWRRKALTASTTDADRDPGRDQNGL